MTRELSRTWSLANIEHTMRGGAQELAPVLQPGEATPMPQAARRAALRRQYAGRDALVAQLWHEVNSPAVAAERLADLIGRSVKVTFLGKFAGGSADVTAELKREGGRMRLWRLRIDSREKRERDDYPGRRVISHA